MARRLHQLPITPHPVPVQLVLGLAVGFAVLGKRSRAKGKFVPGGRFPTATKERAA